MARRDKGLEAVALDALRRRGQRMSACALHADTDAPVKRKRRKKTPAEKLIDQLRESVRRDRLRQLASLAGLPPPEFEHVFHVPAPGEKPRKWRFDLAWPAHMVYAEIDGGIWTGGRHTRGVGWKKDAEKHNAAAALGWRKVVGTPDDAKTGALFVSVRAAIIEG